MKTICPYCYQDFEVPDNYLNLLVTCSACQKNFTVQKGKFCSECGTINPAQASSCRQCQCEFPQNPSFAGESAKENPPLASTSVPAKDDNREAENVKSESSANNLGRGIKVAFGIYAVTIILWIGLKAQSIICYEINNFNYGPNIYQLPRVLADVILVFLGVNVMSMTNAVTKPYRKIYWTPIRRLSLYGFNFLLILSTILYLVRNWKINSTLIWFCFSFFIGFYVIIGIKLVKLYNARSYEDVDFEEDHKYVQKQQLKSVIRGACILASLGILVVAYVLYGKDIINICEYP